MKKFRIFLRAREATIHAYMRCKKSTVNKEGFLYKTRTQQYQKDFCNIFCFFEKLVQHSLAPVEISSTLADIK